MNKNANKLWTLLGSLIAVVLLATTLIVLFYISFFYLGNEEISRGMALNNIVLRFSIMCLISLLTYGVMIGMRRVFSRSSLVSKLSSKSSLWSLFGLSLMLVMMCWGRYLF